MRHESSVTAVSWIPSEAIEGMPKMPFEMGMTHYDPPPPDQLDDVEALIENDGAREANVLRAWIDVEDGKIVAQGQEGRGYVGKTQMKAGPRTIVVPGIGLPTLRSEEPSETSVRFVQTVGGRAGFPAPRRVRGKPFFQVRSSLAWTTLALTLNADGSSSFELAGASPFPRHWIYDDSGKLAQKSGTIDFATWYRESFEPNSPWGDEDSPAVVSEVETSLERELSKMLMSSKPKPRRLDRGDTLVEQGAEGDELYVILDGVVAVQVDGELVAELGPGAVVGERALLEGGKRTATLRATTPVKAVEVSAADLERGTLEELAAGRRREEQRQDGP
jgi:hypothetical protein